MVSSFAFKELHNLTTTPPSPKPSKYGASSPPEPLPRSGFVLVATSATIGEGKDVTNELRYFLRDISGASSDRIHIVLGDREKVLLPAPAAAGLLGDDALVNQRKLAAHPAVQTFVRAAEGGVVTLSQAETMLAPTGQSADRIVTALADASLSDASGNRQLPLLPLRVHGFMRAMPGLWSCLNPVCAGAAPDWPFGAILAERTDTCPKCRSTVLEVKACRECGEPYLECEERAGRLQQGYTPPTVDEFAALREREVADEDDRGDDPEIDTNLPGDDDYDPVPRIIATSPLHRGRLTHVDPHLGKCHDAATEGSVALYLLDPEQCGNCQATAGKAGAVLRPLRFGAPFLIGNAAPVLLEGLAPGKPVEQGAYRNPSGGRQLLSFTDSRQGTARFSANLQATSERAFVRGYIYHAAQGCLESAGDDATLAKIDELRAEIAQLEAVVANAPGLADIIARRKSDLAKCTAVPEGGKPWIKLVEDLASTPEVKHWMTEVWGPRESRYADDPLAFAHFLLLREFNRRPRRGNTAETMGLARLRFPAIMAIKTAPSALLDKGFNVADWQALLHVMIDIAARARFAIRAKWDDMHWLNSSAPLSTLLAPGDVAQGRRELPWPHLRKGNSQPGNIIQVIERGLRLDRTELRDRHIINDLMERAWTALQPVLRDPTQPDFALDLTKTEIAPVSDAWRCPVTRLVLPNLALGMTPYGHFDGLATAWTVPEQVHFPRLPVTFPNEDQKAAVRAWIENDPDVAALKTRGLWTNLHDRVALFSPYLRAAEHSAQQPPARLRGFEKAFRDGRINILNCSTTMEMGVDIGTVSAVMMTNVPPAIANYRQRVGRAGRRRQGFASSLTFSRDTPLDRDAFHDPETYLRRKTNVPSVKLDSRRIVQRHVNALLLARWFAIADGEMMKANVGDFFGCPPGVGAGRSEDAPFAGCQAWLSSPTTQGLLANDIASLTRGTVLGQTSNVMSATHEALVEMEQAIALEWEALQEQAASLAGEARSSVGYQLDRLCNENMLKDLAVRGFLPSHGMPTNVAAFVHTFRRKNDDRSEGETTSRYRSHPSRTLDVAIRDYAPGSEVVVDGLVYTSAGVTLNWRRPADDEQAREIQSIKTFWTCSGCGAADCGLHVPVQCPACRNDIRADARRRFLEPAGFTVDARTKPHADTDEVSFVEVEAEQVVAKGAAWRAMADPLLGRMRGSSDGLVFHSSRGASRMDYHVCLECGRTAPVGRDEHNLRPLKDHSPLRRKNGDQADICAGNEKSFRIVGPLALGYEATTDVAEIQPSSLPGEGAALAIVAALRDALARHLGVEVAEMGIAVKLATAPLGQRTYSLLLFDRAAGGAGFAQQAVSLFEVLLPDIERILDCRELGCVAGCSSCILTADLQRRHDQVDRLAALDWVRDVRSRLGNVDAEDRAAPDAMYCRSVADDLLAAVDAGAQSVTVWLGAEADPSLMGEGTLALMARRVVELGARLNVVAEANWLDQLDPAARLALRDVAREWRCSLRKGVAPACPNGALVIAEAGGARPRRWASRDPVSALPGTGWGLAHDLPIVSMACETAPLSVSVALDSLLPVAGTNYLQIDQQLDGTVAAFGPAIARMLVPTIRSAGGNGALESMHYNDRYIQSPLVARLMAGTLSALADALGKTPNTKGGGLPVEIATNRFKPNERQPFAPDHDWQYDDERREVVLALLGRHGFESVLTERGAGHGRVLTLHFVGGSRVRVVFDQGFGPWRTPSFARFDFGDSARKQAEKIHDYSGYDNSAWNQLYCRYSVNIRMSGALVK